MKCEIRKGMFDRFYLFHPTMCGPYLAWSGSRWTKVSPEGLPLDRVQACNFETVEEARDYCEKNHLETVGKFPF